MHQPLGRLGASARLCGRGQRVEAVELRLDVARTRVGRGVDQPVARHHAVLARAPNPVVAIALARGQVDQFGSVAAQNEIFLGRLVSVAAVVRHDDAEELLVIGPSALDPAGQQIACGRDARLASRDQITRPDQSVGHEHVGRRVVRLAAIAGPELLAGGGREGRHPAFGRDAAARVDQPLARLVGLGRLGRHGVDGPIAAYQNVAGDDQRRRRPGRPSPADRAVGTPIDVSRGGVEREHFLVVLVEQPPTGGGQRGGHRLVRVGVVLGPEQLAAIRLDRRQMLQRRRFLLDRPPVPDLLRVLGPGGTRRIVGHTVADDGEQRALVQDDFQRAGRLTVGANGLSGSRVERTDRLAVTERDVDAILQRDEPPGQIRRSAAEAAQVPLPRSDRPFPEQHAAERVAGDEEPLGLDRDHGGGAFVDDVEDPPAGRYHRADAR